MISIGRKYFFLISHSVIANVKEILTFSKKPLEIELKNHSKVSVSRRKAKEFRTYIADNSDQTNLLKRILSFFK
ncbi:MAG: LytTR family transcriptional regulator DNA-binding domain-containing protein [Saprospiraceae bacterium]|nr:LytTR family transcriptional regulator DNA-binding domain-containing protein [Saprospiraceae bacterium]